MVREIVVAAPTGVSLLGLTDRELMDVLLRCIGAVTDDPVRRMVSLQGVLVSLFPPSGPYAISQRANIEQKITRAWRALEGAQLIEEPDATNGANGYRVISANGRQVGTDVNHESARNRAWLTSDKLHSALRGTCFRTFANGDYDIAVFEAFKVVEGVVKTRSGAAAPRDFGVNLMEDAFRQTSGPLTDQAAQANQQNARRNLFMGAMGEFRNRTGHGGAQAVITDPLEAIEQIMFASALLRLLR